LNFSSDNQPKISRCYQYQEYLQISIDRKSMLSHNFKFLIFRLLYPKNPNNVNLEWLWTRLVQNHWWC
jgi:hypothetical protein